MIAKAKSCIGGTQLFGYVANEKKGYELERNNISGKKASGLFQSMQVIQNQNLRCKNNTISIVLSPEKNDGKAMTVEQWKDLTRHFISDLGVNIEDAQYLSFIHTEKEHTHVHIILNRVKDDGSLIKDHFIGKRAQHIVHRIAKEMNLQSAREIKQKKEKDAKTVLKDFREDFRNAHESVKNHYPKSLQEYTDLMKKEGFMIKPSINKQGIIQGFKIYNPTIKKDVKLSQIDRKIKLDEKFFAELSSQRQQVERNSSIENEILRKNKRKNKLKR